MITTTLYLPDDVTALLDRTRRALTDNRVADAIAEESPSWTDAAFEFTPTEFIERAYRRLLPSHKMSADALDMRCLYGWVELELSIIRDLLRLAQKTLRDLAAEDVLNKRDLLADAADLDGLIAQWTPARSDDHLLDLADPNAGI